MNFEVNAGENLGDTGWEDLAGDGSRQHKERLEERARMYRKFGKMAMLLAELDGTEPQNDAGGESDAIGVSSETTDSSEDEAHIDLQVESLFKQMENILGDVDKSLKNQIEYSIVNHKKINTRDALERELQSGTSIPELDIRFDKDGKPWISHSPRAGARFFFSKPIHNLNSEQVEQYSRRLSLEDGLQMFAKYKKDNENHRMVLELKELGPSSGTHNQYLENIKSLLDKHEVADSAIFATLSPSILRSAHDVFPDNSMILNGGIAPIISYNLAEKSLGPSEEKEYTAKIPHVELVFSNSTEIVERADGYGKQTGYLWTRLPKETVNTLAGLNTEGGTGAASLTIVNMFANVMEKLSPKMAERMRKYYAAQLDKLGIQKQVAIAKKNPAESLLRTKAQMGQDSIIYSDTSPGDWATDLPDYNKNGGG